ncbi:MAG: MC/SLC25 family protein, partial [Flammeovirgaceae bacterium]
MVVGELVITVIFITFLIQIQEVFSYIIIGQPHWSMMSLSGFLGGFTAGVMSNPIEIVYNRQVADGLLPNHLKRNYSNFFDGLLKVNHERVLFRGAVASGCAFGMLNASMSGIYDYLKEYLYFFFGPPAWLRPLCLLPTAALGAACYLPFDNIKVRLHTMRPLPNG